MSNGLDPDQARCSVWPDLGPKMFAKICRQTTKFAASRHIINVKKYKIVIKTDFHRSRGPFTFKTDYEEIKQLFLILPFSAARSNVQFAFRKPRLL